MTKKPKPLVVIPTFLREEQDVAVTEAAVLSVRKTVSDSVDTLLVDDGSPEKDLVDLLESRVVKPGTMIYRKHENSGFSKTVNIGLERARDQGRHAVLLNADMEITTPGWIRRMVETRADNGNLADVVGALLLFPNGLIQHAGIYMSLVTRTFDHLYKYAPGDLPDANKLRVCPVTGAFQFIRHTTLERVGLYDEEFHMGWEDVDYNIRVYKAGGLPVFNPAIRGYHHEMLFRGRPSEKVADWQQKSFMYLCMKYREQSFGGLVPFA